MSEYKEYHTPVLLHKAVEYLINPVFENPVIIDCTLGGGSYYEEIIKKVGITARCIGIDRDDNALDYSIKKFSEKGINAEIIHGNFGRLKDLLAKKEIHSVSGIVLDLGLSSYQIENEDGFSFMRDTRFDMRADGKERITAAEIVNTYSEEKLNVIFSKYGDIRKPERLSKAIIKFRRKEKIKKTTDMLKMINSEYSLRKRDANDFYAKIFQSIRIEVNNEMENLDKVLNTSSEILKSGGRLVVVSYHSLEDRMVKNFIKSRKDIFETLTKKPVIPEYEEIKKNRRSRSAKLRAAEKL